MDGDAAPRRVEREAPAPLGATCGLGALAVAMEPALLEVAGPGATCVSVSLEFARTPRPGAPLRITAWVERATRTLVFAAAEVMQDGERTGAATAIFSRAP